MGAMSAMLFTPPNPISPHPTEPAHGPLPPSPTTHSPTAALQVWDTERCFVNSHLAALQDKVRARNSQYRDIVKGVRLDPWQMDVLTAYHHTFWMGDLNYRLDYGMQVRARAAACRCGCWPVPGLRHAGAGVVHGVWCAVYGARCVVVHGVWCTVCGARCVVVHGVWWCTVCGGARCVVHSVWWCTVCGGARCVVVHGVWCT